ncbi:MAG: hypothetical protein WBD31_16650, partial [Rubripirellula sp.]
MLIIRPLIVFFSVAAWLLLQPWCQAQPPVVDGLVVQLDVVGLAQESNSPSVDSWKNGVAAQEFSSGGDASETPQLVKVGDSFVVRFDGDDVLRCVGNRVAPNSSMSVFVVAAPHENLGDFRGIVAANAPGRRDYESGFNMDLGPAPTGKLDNLNMEGAGFGGAADLLDASFDFGTLHVFSAIISADSETIALRVDGKLTGQRAYEPTSISLEQLTLGARYYTNGQGEQ